MPSAAGLFKYVRHFSGCLAVKVTTKKKKKKKKRNDVKWRCYGVFSSLEHFQWDYLMDLLTTLNKFWLLY